MASADGGAYRSARVLGVMRTGLTAIVVTLWLSSLRAESLFRSSMRWQQYRREQQVWVSKVCSIYIVSQLESTQTPGSFERHRDRHWEEDVFNLDRWFNAWQSCCHMSKYWDCIFWHGTWLPSAYRQSTQECPSLLEDIRRISTNTCIDSRNCYRHAASDAIRVSLELKRHHCQFSRESYAEVSDLTVYLYLSQAGTPIAALVYIKSIHQVLSGHGKLAR